MQSKNNPLITVIIPIYKVEAYLDECVQSILNQTYHNLEIILVDDGSPDRCGEMCEVYAEKDARVKVIHQKNKGLSGARNSAIDIATGEYQLFCINVVLLVLADWMQSSRLFQNIPFVVIVFKYSALLFGILAFILEYKKGLNIKETAKLCFLILLSLLTCLKTRNMSYLLILN